MQQYQYVRLTTHSAVSFNKGRDTRADLSSKEELSLREPLFVITSLSRHCKMSLMLASAGQQQVLKVVIP